MKCIINGKKVMALEFFLENQEQKNMRDIYMNFTTHIVTNIKDIK
jgi:hypothetical protein